MEIDEYISGQSIERQALLTKLHHIIIQEDKTIAPIVEPMMGKEMIIYKAKGMMKYGLASMKQHMSLHVLPIYINQPLHVKYEALLPKASFQKGCINFNSEEEIPLTIVRDLIVDCSKIDLVKIREEQLKARKSRKK